MERVKEINKVVIELNDGSIHYLDFDEQIEIDGRVMTAQEYKDEFQTKTTEGRSDISN
jgi:hypothetical protein